METSKNKNQGVVCALPARGNRISTAATRGIGARRGSIGVPGSRARGEAASPARGVWQISV